MKKITLDRSGGFGGINTHIEIDAETLPEEKKSDLKKLIEAILPFKGKANDPKPDVFNYSLDIEDETESFQVKTNDLDADDHLHRLFDWLLKESRVKKN